MARRNGDDQGFGSDSFLDVVANIVGILIILIVIAGLRVSRAPVAVQPVITVEEPAPLPVVPSVVDLSELDIPAPVPTPVPREPAPLPPAAPPKELVARADDLKLQIRLLSEEVDRAQQAAKKAEDVQSAGATSLQTLTETVEREAADLERAEQQAQQERARLDQTHRDLANLRATLAQVRREQPDTEVLTHRIAPMGRQVQGLEAHFLLQGDRVAVVPLDALADALKFKIEHNRSTLMRVDRYDGTIGPIEGFRMQYVIERQRVSILEELREGQRLIRMGVTFFELEPTPELVTESVEQARASGSRFRRELSRAGADATLTFWVYPESFDSYRELLALAHSSGYDVAARPLPTGVPIAGSPQGSKSVAQ